MAEITSSTSSQTTGIRKPQKKSTRVDLTPMVDLGFLLITFFIFTTTISQPTAMKLVMPKDVDDINNRMPTKKSATLTLLLANNNTVYYYEGLLDETASNLKVTSLQTLRHVILDKKKRTNASDLFIIVKAAKSSVYKTVVDVLDEMTINDIRRYALVDITPTEEQVVDTVEQDN